MLVAGFVPACNDIEANCRAAPPKGVAPRYCSTHGATLAATVCRDATVPTAGVGVGFCRIWKTGDGVRHPGPCGCPSSCSEAAGHGVCRSGRCVCAAGWGGADCSLPNCTHGGGGGGGVNVSVCLGGAACAERDGEMYCACPAGRTGPQCEIAVTRARAPDVPATVDAPQYSAADVYGLHGHPVLNDTTVAQVRLTVPRAVLDWFLDPAQRDDSAYRGPVRLWFDNGVVRETVEECAIKHSGSLMLLFPKKNIRLSFGARVHGRTWHGLKSVVLKSAALDPAFAREMLATAVGYSLGMPVPRISLAQVWVNGEYFGLYQMYEPYDSAFLKTRAALGHGKAAWWKTHWGGNLTVVGDGSAAAYAQCTVQGKPCYDAKTDKAAASFDAIARLARALNATPLVPADIEAVLDVPFLLRTLVLESATANWDGTPNNGNNLLLYLDPATARLKIWRHDLDLSFGFPLSVNLAQRSFDTTDVYTFNRASPLARILTVPAYRAQYTQIYRRLLKTYLRLDGALLERIRLFHDLAAAPAADDQWHQQCLALSTADFDHSIDQKIGNITGILPFLRARIEASEKQLDQ